MITKIFSFGTRHQKKVTFLLLPLLPLSLLMRYQNKPFVFFKDKNSKILTNKEIRKRKSNKSSEKNKE